MEVDSDAGVEPTLVRRGTKRASSMREERATVGGIETEQTQVQECKMFRRRHKYEQSSVQTVISTTTSHKAKRDETQPRIVTLEYADAVRAPEHYASTQRTRAVQSVISRVMSKCRTRQPESCDTSSAFFHAWHERGVRMKLPKDPRLSDGWRWQLAEAFLLPGVNSQWSPGSARRMTDAECVENLAGLSAVQELKPSSRASGRGQCSVLETSTAAESVVHRKVVQFSTKELTHDVQTPSMLSMLKPRRVAWYLVGGADLSPFFVCLDEPGATSVQADVDWSGNEMTCRTTSAGAVQLESHEIEAWSMIQQVVLLSSAESQFYACRPTGSTVEPPWFHLLAGTDEVIVNGYWPKRVKATRPPHSR